MPSRNRLLLAGAALTAAASIAACSGAPAAPALTDPDEILVKSVESLQTVKSFHLDVGVAGSLNLDLMGTGTTSEFPLDTTTFAGDFDIANEKARFTFDIPALMGLSGEALLIGDVSYVKTTLTGPLYIKSAVEATDEVPTDPTAAIAELRTALAETEGLEPTLGADVACGDKQCYNVQLALTPELLASLDDGSLPMGEIPEGSATVAFNVEKDTLRPASIVITADGGAQGTLTLTLGLSAWDQAVTIAEPPADQVTDEAGGLFGG